MANRQLVCAFVEDQAVGTKFERIDWPLHVTVVPWFRLPKADTGFVPELARELQQHDAFTAVVDRQSRTRYFGDRRVSVMESTPWQPLHQATLEVVRHHAGTLLARTFIGSSYRPHVTFQKHGHLEPADQFACDALYVVEKRKDMREVIHKLPLGYE